MKTLESARQEIIAELWIIKNNGKPISQVYLKKNYPKLLGKTLRRFGSLGKAHVAMGLDPKKEVWMKWTEDKIIQELKAIKLRNEAINTNNLKKNYNNLLTPMKSRFGSWENAVKAAGFNPEEERRDQRTRASNR